jgi:DNA gyrase subunit A
LDDVIETIRRAADADTAKTQLMERFKLSEIQAQAILDLQLRRLAALERQKIEAEHQEVVDRITYLEDLLASPHKILEVVSTDLDDLVERYGDARRTHITAEAHEELRIEDLVADEAVLISITQRGYIKRTIATAYRAQGRGGRGVNGQTMREEDEMLTLLPARTLHTILFFSDRGKVYSEKVYQIPDAGRADRGTPMVNLLALENNERITAAVAIPEFSEGSFCTMATSRGRVKRVSLTEFSSVRPSGLIAINLEEGDTLNWVRLTHGKDEIVLVTQMGQALRFSERQIRSMGRPAAGVTGIRMKPGDQVAGMEVVDRDGSLVVITQHGYGKRTLFAEYSAKGRGTHGIATINQSSLDVIGKIAAVRVVRDDDDLTIISTGGQILRMQVKTIRPLGRAARGVRLINLQNNETVASLGVLLAADKPQEEPGTVTPAAPEAANDAGAVEQVEADQSDSGEFEDEVDGDEDATDAEPPEDDQE